jgi:hypothetical protein
MEAVARYAAEVAATCETLLSDVKHEAEEWMGTLPSGAAKYHGEVLLDEVGRAAALIRQLSDYGQQQKDAPILANLRTVLDDLTPVLTRVAGTPVDVTVPDLSTPLHVDAEAERVERMLVNVAAHARGRLRGGGRLRIEAAPVLPDRDFAEKYPNVRPGTHIVLTVTEVREPAPADVEAALGERSVAGRAPGPSAHELSTLQALVNDCSGHLWLMTEPAGNLVLKIHLPRRALDDLDRPAPTKSSGRGRWLGRLAGVRR